jgi:hypothetical protein
MAEVFTINLILLKYTGDMRIKQATKIHIIAETLVSEGTYRARELIEYSDF